MQVGDSHSPKIHDWKRDQMVSMFVSLIDSASENVTQRRHSTQEKIPGWLAVQCVEIRETRWEIFVHQPLRKTRETSRLSLYL